MPSQRSEEEFFKALEEAEVELPSLGGFPRMAGFARLTPIEIDHVSTPISTQPIDKFIPRTLFAIHTVVVSADGSSDFENIQDAINSLPENGGLVIIKEGTYSPDTSITLNKNNITLRGGSWGTIIDMVNIPGANPSGISSSSKNNLLIENLRVIDTSFGGGTGIKLSNCNDSKIRNCLVANNNDGISISSCNNIIIENNKIDDMQGDFGIKIGGTSTFCIVQNNRCVDSNITFEGADKSIINNNTITFPADGAIHLFSDADNNIISNNIIFITEGGNPGIWLEGSNDNNLINANRISGATNAIDIESGSDRTLVTSNLCRGCTTAVVNDGTNTTLDNNTT